MIRKPSLGVSIFILTMATFAISGPLAAHAGVSSKETKYVEFAGRGNLQQFGPVKRQVGGTCHIYAAAALFEAACFRKTKVHVSVSEAQLYVHHLKSIWQNESPATSIKTEQADDGSVSVTLLKNDQPLVPQVRGHLTGMDAGDPAPSLQLLVSGKSSVSATDFAFNDAFQNTITSIVREFGTSEVNESNQALQLFKAGRIDKREALDRQYRVRISVRRQALQKLRTEMSNAFDGVLKPDPAIAACVSTGIKPRQISRPSLDAIRTELSHGSPILCSVNMIYVNSNGTRSEGPHALIIAEARKSESSTWEYLMRDSNLSEPQWTSIFNGCNSAWVLE